MTGAATDLELLAQDVFEVARLLSLSSPKLRRGVEDLKEGEFLSLSMLEEQGTMVVGDIQRRLGVLPAQMSRIIRSLESREQPLVVCHINSLDKRKIDVRLTEAGQRALQEHRRFRIGRILDLLDELGEDERESLAPVLEHVRDILRRRGRDEIDE